MAWASVFFCSREKTIRPALQDACSVDHAEGVYSCLSSFLMQLNPWIKETIRHIDNEEKCD